MARYIYPAVFEKEGDCFNVSFPDLPGCNTFGKGLQASYDMAEDALAFFLYDHEENERDIPPASAIDELSCGINAFLTLISCDTVVYREKHDNRLVNKTVTIENWLNKLAERNHLNCSRLLRNAIKETLGIK